jgi:hypothetical protein
MTQFDSPGKLKKGLNTFLCAIFLSATSVTIANNANKIFIIGLSEIFVDPTLYMTTSARVSFVWFLRWLYSQSTTYFSKLVFILAVIIVTVFVGAFNHKNLNILMNELVSNRQTSMRMDSFIIEKFQTFINKEKHKGKEIYKSYLPLSKLSRPSNRISPGIRKKNTTESQLPKICVNRNASIWRTCDPPRCKADSKTLKLNYPRTTIRGENTGEFINRILEIAWGPDPPSIDLYLRSGCNGIDEMKYLFESIEIFWPRFLGSVVVALDVGDEVFLDKLLPANPTHHYVIGFEHLPCISPRVFNQYSYLNLDRHCTADYVVTIDSDCVFHTPVTPDLIFRQGKLILASSRTFQGAMWVSSIDSMMGVGMYDGHYMVTQPVTFSLSTFSSFREWFYNSKGICYEDRLSRLPPQHHPNFCWMCQLGTYLERGHPTESEHKIYRFLHLDNATLEPFLRYSTHVTYEPHIPPPTYKPVPYGESVNEVIKQGLCRAFGPSVFRICANYSNFNYVNLVTFLYAHMEIQTANQTVRSDALSNYLKRLSKVTAMALDRSKRLFS